MGMDVQNAQTETPAQTCAQVVQKCAYPEAAARAYIMRTYHVKMSAECTPEIERGLRKMYAQKTNVQNVQKPVNVQPVPEVQPKEKEQPAKETRKFTLKRQYLLDGINTGEMLLVLIGSWVMFGAPGLIPGLICVAFYAHSAGEMRNGQSAFAQDAGLFVCACLSAVFMWLHGQTFWAWFAGAQDLRYSVSMVSAALISIVSVCALWQTRNVRA